MPDETPTEVVEDVVEQETALPDDAVEHDPPPWAEQLIKAVEALPDRIAEALPNPVNPEVSPEDGGEDAEHGDEIPGADESPSRPPWTHRGFGR